MKELEEMGEKLMEVRVRKDMSQAQAARFVGIVPPVWCRYEQGKQWPNSASLVRICKAFGISADYLLGLRDPEK